MAAPCTHCNKPAASNVCACRAAFYCDAACQKAHWLAHREACKQTRAAAAAAAPPMSKPPAAPA